MPHVRPSSMVAHMGAVDDDGLPSGRLEGRGSTAGWRLRTTQPALRTAAAAAAAAAAAWPLSWWTQLWCSGRSVREPRQHAQDRLGLPHSMGWTGTSPGPPVPSTFVHYLVDTKRHFAERAMGSFPRGAALYKTWKPPAEAYAGRKVQQGR